MAERRSIDDALALAPEKLAFIHGAKVVAQPESAPKKTHQQANAKREDQHDARPAAKPQRETNSKKRAGRRRSRRVETVTTPEPEAAGLVGQLLVPLTTRLRPKTAQALRRACLEQKLAGKRPHSQQDIIEAAAQAWLMDNNFL